MQLETVLFEDKKRWDEIVCSFANYDVYYLNGYFNAFEGNGDGKPFLLHFTGENTRAINIVMKRDIADCPHFSSIIPKNNLYDFSTVYGYGGFLIEGNETELVNKIYSEYCRQNNIISEFVRFHPLLENRNGLNHLYDIVPLGNTVYIDTTSRDLIWQNISSKNRNMIRKAEKNGVKISIGYSEELVEEFMKIYQETMDRDNADEYYYFSREFYNDIFNNLRDNATFIYAEYEEEIISIAIFLYANNRMHYHLSASKSEYKHLAPSNLMIYEAALWACDNGILTLHLGGGLGSKEDSLYKFKKSFNRNQDARFFIGKKIFDENAYSLLVDLRNKTKPIENTNFFPEYRG